MCSSSYCQCQEENIPVIPATPSSFCTDVRNCENQRLIYNSLTGELSITQGNGLTILNTITVTVPLLVSDTPSVDMTLLGNTISADVLISSAVGNTITINPDGLYSPSGAGESTTVSDTTTVDLTLTGTDITADVIISPNAGNTLVNDGLGLYVPSSTMTVSDTTTLDLNVLGNDISGSVIISPTGGNALSDIGNGLYVTTITGESTTVADTNSVDLTLTGYQITADVNINPSAPNSLSITPSGLLVDNCSIGQLLVDGVSITKVAGLDASNCLVTIPDGLVGQVLTRTIAGVEFQTPSAGTNFTITDGVNSEVINSGNTITFQAGLGVQPIVSATDTVTMDINEITEQFSGLSIGNTIVLSNVPAGGLKVYRNGLRQFEGVGEDYTTALSTITFTTTFSGSEKIIVDYFL